jgi:hypothetical protein
MYKAIADSTQDIKPRHHKATKHINESEDTGSTTPKPAIGIDDDSDSDFDDDDDDEAESWNLRKCSAAALDVLSTVLENQMLPHLLPLLTAELNHTDWKHREAGILALGAVADGCYEGMCPHLGGLIPLLVKTMNDEVVGDGLY